MTPQKHIHICRKQFKSDKIDRCSGIGMHKCFGTNPMILKVQFVDTDAFESLFDNWTDLKVKFCPFCGLKSDD